MGERDSSMNGSIKTYLPEKGYGFIKGDDGKDYFFHQSEFIDKEQVCRICEESIVNFQQVANPKGYKATQCRLLDTSNVLSYAVPEDFITSRSKGVKGWEIIDGGNWLMHGESEHSPDDAKQVVINRAAYVGANALVDLQYYKTTGSRPGRGKGTYYFTIHNFRGRPVNLAKRNATGGYSKESLSSLQPRINELKQSLLAKTKASKTKRNIVWLFVSIFSIASIPSVPGLIILFLILGIIFGRSSNFDYLLEQG